MTWPCMRCIRTRGRTSGSWKRLYRLFRKIHPTVVHTRNIGCLEAQIPAWLAGVPCRVHGEHGWDISDPNGNNRKYQWLRRLHSPLVHRFIALSKELENYLVRRAHINANKVSRIYNGVDNRRFHPGESDALPQGFASSDSIVFGTVGRMHGVKDQVNLCRAFVQLCQQQATLAPRLRLVMVGDGPLQQKCIATARRGGSGRTGVAGRQSGRSSEHHARIRRVCTAVASRGHIQYHPRGDGLWPAGNRNRCRW